MCFSGALIEQGAEIECVPLPFGDLPALEQLPLGELTIGPKELPTLFWGFCRIISIV